MRLRERPSLEQLSDGVRAGDRAMLSRAITLAESSREDDVELAQELIAELLPETGGSQRIGLSGVPGAGKSTMLETFGSWLVERDHKVAVLVIDPSSARTGGSILGDKTRMPKLSLIDEAYVRPSPSAGFLGGTGRRTREALLLCEAAGYDVTIVESVGVGQSEAVLAHMVDVFCLLLVPGAGDDLQGIKRGIVELADLIVVNKADSGREKEAKRAAGDYRHALKLLPPATPGWTTPVLTASAREGTGIEEMWNAIGEHRLLLERDGLLEKRRREQMLWWLRSHVEEAAMTAFRRRPGVPEALAEAERAVTAGETTVPLAAREVLIASGLLEADETALERAPG